MRPAIPRKDPRAGALTCRVDPLGEIFHPPRCPPSQSPLSESSGRPIKCEGIAVPTEQRRGAARRNLRRNHEPPPIGATGELLRELTLYPSRDHQPTGAPKGPKRRTPK